MSDHLSIRSLALFPGQGSQKVGMGRELFENSPLARSYFERADAALGFSLSAICFDGPNERLTSTEIAQPAILTVSSILYCEAEGRGALQPSPLAGAGHSLGEYSALVAAKAIEFDDAVLLVHKRGRFMQEAVPPGEGKMVAILGKEVSEIEDALVQITDGIAEIANINAPGQIVVAGHAHAVDQLKEKLVSARIVELAVSAPFHSSLMAPAAAKLEAELATVAIKAPVFPIYANYNASSTSDPETIRENLVQQVCGRVRWVDSMKNAIEEQSINRCLEFGYGAVLSGMMKRIAPSTERIVIDSVQSIDALPGKDTL